jgi:hypothetical protein
MGVRQICMTGSWQPVAGDAACVPCSSSAECAGTEPICDGIACVPCDDDCPNAAACSSSGACVECTASDTSACTAAASVCSPENQCVQCTLDDASACGGASPICGTDDSCRACQTDLECGADLVCDPVSGACVGCVDAADCAAGESCHSGSCVQCVTHQDCDPRTPICDGATCRRCESDTECPLGCNPNGRCNACEDSDDCSGSTPICAGGECRGCQPGNCTSGVCNPQSGACDPCSGDNCAGLCEGGICTECSGLLCPDGRICLLGECLACDGGGDAGGSAPCPTGVCVGGICL